MNMAYIRSHYGVPARRGARVEYIGHAPVRQGVITSARSGRLMVRLDGEKLSYPFHPTCDLNYLSASSDTAHGS